MSFFVFVVSQKQLCYYSNVGSAGLAAVLRIGLGIESNLLTFLERLEALSVDTGEVYDNIISLLVRDETGPLRIVEPLYWTRVHCDTSKKLKNGLFTA